MADRHDDLIAELRALGDFLDVPAPRDQRAAVRAGIAQRKATRRWRLWLIGILVAAAGATGVVAPARAAVVSAVGGLLRVTGVSVRTGPPAVVPASPSPLPFEHVTSVEAARHTAKFPIRVPAALGDPQEVTIADDARVVSFTYRHGRVRLDQCDGTIDPVFFKEARNAEYVDVGTDYGIWVPAAHEVTYVDRNGTEHTLTARLAGPTLIWSHLLVTYRLEGVATLDEALDVARSMA